MNPLSIPLKIRQAYYNKENLVPDTSFEHENYHESNNRAHSYTIKNWKIIGKDVRVTDIRKSVLIVRQRARGIMR
jgi:hypothetical protein